ncbi:hypothetical protein [Flavivirga eckloniae]|uniref:Lipocalin-like domain-containing protein n=1 Tax=Flavivirga eckloniae TaxID=1803846 RepID=A0A2K9PU98_9FLAO|nr:hypothetical protein [Flavivirga eckloniae]AUP80633.1 hypothetical protein C1H87_18715 [Flavivirga eckloniae]
MVKIFLQLIFYVLFLVLGMTHVASSQNMQKEHLAKYWKLNSYRIDSKSYPISKKEKGDKLLLHANMSFVSVFEGEKESGMWYLDASKGIVYLYKNEDDKEPLPIEILKLTANSLEVRLDIPEIKKVVFIYKKMEDG